ncbi:MAG TPA: hypothetical protein VKY24_24690 [Reyranella sp.]|nr:hypothetical protein [Reyranella sp.]
MGSLLTGKFATMWEINAQAGHEHPVFFSIYLAVLLGFVAAAVALIWRWQAHGAFWCAVGAIVGAYFFSWGDDSFTHTYRIAALADQVRNGPLSAFLLSPSTGEGVPTFVYYSHVSYLLPVLLALLGLPALWAFKLSMMLYFVVMAAGVQAMVERSAPAKRDREQLQRDYLVALLFLGANYVYSLWFARASLAEIWVYCLMPWVVASALSPITGRWLAIFLFLQTCGHPIVMAQCLVAEVIVAYSLSGLTPLQLVRRGLVPSIAAVVLSVPFWLPQGLWQGLILGPKALPASFEESFVTLLDLVRFHHVRTVGIWMPLATILVVIVARARLSLQFWVPAIVGFVLILLQARPFYPITRLIPTLDLSIFVWRLALPAAVLLLGALLVGWREVPRASRGLPALASLALLGMVFLMLQFPGGMMNHLSWQDDRVAITEFEQLDGVWGVSEYLPQYKGIAVECTTPDARRVSYRDLRNGVEARARYIRVPHGPVGLVDYEADGTDIAPKACGDDLVLGPLLPTAHVAVLETRMNRLTLIRAIGFIVALVLMLAVIPFVAWSGEDRAAF